MKASARKFLYELLETPSPTGFEFRGQRCWANYVRKFSDNVESDAYGTAWATVKGSGKTAPTVMLESHADEIGYIVKYVDEKGFIFIDRLAEGMPRIDTGKFQGGLFDVGAFKGVDVEVEGFMAMQQAFVVHAQGDGGHFQQGVGIAVETAGFNIYNNR